MVAAQLQGSSSSPKQQAPVAADSTTNGTLPLQYSQEQRGGPCCHAPGHLGEKDAAAAVGPLALTLGGASAATDLGAACRCSCRAPAADAPEMVVVPSAVRGSRYLVPAQELLRDAVSMAGASAGLGGGDSDADEDDEGADETRVQGATKDGLQAKLLGLLSELESREDQYFEELGRVALSFEPALGPAATAGYTSLMSRAMSRHFGNLRRAILRKLRLLHAAAAARRPPRVDDGRDGGEESEEEEEEEVTEEMVKRLVRRKKQAAAARAAEQVCKPMRGLPEDSVAVLRAWLFDHFLNPYPSDNEKLRLAVSTGLSRGQISNWFINARVRLWKPMIEEMYNDEFSEDSVSMDDAASS